MFKVPKNNMNLKQPIDLGATKDLETNLRRTLLSLKNKPQKVHLGTVETILNSIYKGARDESFDQ